MVEFRSFGRRRGRKLQPLQSELYDRLLPRIFLALPDSEAWDMRRVFPNLALPLNLEIGFGGGEYLFHRAQAFPEQNFIGAEPYENGVAKFLSLLATAWDVEALEARNVRVYDDDVRDLIGKMPNNLLDRIDIMFPDPWPKSRHHRRRLINHVFVQELERVLRPEGMLCIATDHEGYLEVVLSLIQRFPNFCWQASCAADWQKPWYGVHTRYAEKAEIAGRRCYYLDFVLKK
ncbi:MAG: tRNA (guanosine(46)-N7)-methyltransferase TrmB [Alphaproteobacteria bacterium]|nr:tRNA (guanosine(46)-N7)-methyltransferase TrmB [Alphaproteobacteria bacterium]